MVEATPFWGAIGLSCLLVLSLLSVPIAASMGIVGLGMVLLFYGDFTALQFIATSAWGNTAKYSMSMFPLFILMGNLIAKSGLGEDAFDGLNKLLGRTRGGLAMVSTPTCALFGTVSGSSSSTIIAIGGTAIPEMRRHGYSAPLRCGSVAVNGCIANLIPPSLAAVLYCVVTETSIAKLFIAGLIPGLVLTVMILAVIYIWATVRPEDAPRSTETYPLKERLAGLRTPLPMLCIFAFMIVGIYNGFFSPAEAAGMGVLATIVMMVVLGKFTWRKFFDAVSESVKLFTFMFVALMAAVMFASTIALSQLPQFIADWALATVDSPLAILYMIIVIFIIAGCILENFGMVMMLVPLFYPVIAQARFYGVFFWVIMVIMMKMSMLTPPIGINVFVLHGIARDIPLKTIFRGIGPFLVADLVRLTILVIFVDLALWLPRLMNMPM